MPTVTSRSWRARSGSLENIIIWWLANTLPIGLFKRLPVFYHKINRYRFRLFARPVMLKETSKAKERREAEGFFERYFSGRGIDVGYGGDLVVPNCRGWDVEDGDAHDLAGIADDSFDFVYSSHVLEHLDDPARAVRNWWRVLKPGGYLILYLPERDLFERKRTLPSTVCLDHKHFFLLDRDDPPDTTGLVPLLQRNLAGLEIVYQQICSDGYDPTKPINLLWDAEYSIELVAKKSANGASIHRAN
ncbi:MAG TPA: class I SAM-dependent methyltransferase [Stellaceae bacterium]|nr:class I SAM-dependent methyltransferase [Stellaceae bacterium]